MVPVAALILVQANATSFEYVDQTIEGWSVHAEKALVGEHPYLWGAVKQELTLQLIGIERVVPDGPLVKLKTIPIWIHLNSPGNVCAAFHPESGWLKDHGMDPHMAHGFEIGNAEHFVSWTYEQPWMVMHELAHGYHFLFLPNGFDNADVKATYATAMAAKRYDLVRHWNGAMVKAYATTNPMEYFSETTEAYFGTNDFYPFVRGELMSADPDGYTLMRKVWGEPQKRVPKG